MIIGICGFGFTGSGAVLDFLREIPEVSVNEKAEISFIYDPDGLLDLEKSICEHPIRFFSGDASIKRFKSYMLSYEMVTYMERVMSIDEYKSLINEFLFSITKTTWNGYWHYDKRKLSKFSFLLKYKLGWKYLRIFDKLRLEIPKIYPNNQKMFIPVGNDQFMASVYSLMRNFLEAMDVDTTKKIVLDQPFPANEPQLVYHFFEDECKAIVVKKDPRDMYVFVKEYCKLDACFIPHDTVEDFINFYHYQMSICNFNDSTLVLNFEDLIYNYNNTTLRICKFLSISNVVGNKQYFDPSKSIGNTQIFKKFAIYQDDIKKIENELGEYLFDFESYGNTVIEAQPFVY